VILGIDLQQSFHAPNIQLSVQNNKTSQSELSL
jgi:hypothetical protein